MTATQEEPAVPASTSKISKVSDKPADVSLNLDTLEREGGDPTPFVFVLGGDRFVCRDIESEDWQYLESLDENDPKDTFKLLLGEGDYERFAQHRLPLWKLKTLMKQWRDHVGVGVDGLGDFGGSPTS